MDTTANTSACTDSDTTNAGAALAPLLIGGTRVRRWQSEIQMGVKITITSNHQVGLPHLIMKNVHLTNKD